MVDFNTVLQALPFLAVGYLLRQFFWPSRFWIVKAVLSAIPITIIMLALYQAMKILITAPNGVGATLANPIGFLSYCFESGGEWTLLFLPFTVLGLALSRKLEK